MTTTQTTQGDRLWTLHRWRTHIPGISDTNGVTSDAKFASDAKLR